MAVSVRGSTRTYTLVGGAGQETFSGAYGKITYITSISITNVAGAAHTVTIQDVVYVDPSHDDPAGGNVTVNRRVISTPDYNDTLGVKETVLGLNELGGMGIRMLGNCVIVGDVTDANVSVTITIDTADE